MRLTAALVFVGGVVVFAPRQAVGAEPTDLVVVLTETGRTCDSGLPVLMRHPQAATYLPVLKRGISGRLLRAYRWEQRWLAARDGREVESAYLLLSSSQGGFPRFGFCLDDARKPGVGYVDLHQSQRPSGVFGAIDQIFPHELLHVIARQLAGESPAGGANQVHAIAVRTDPAVAFHEGFAEHIQALAIDDADAAPETAALATDRERRDRAERQLEAYRRALTARWAPAPRARLGFVMWFGSAEQALRYHGVKANRFGYEPAIPDRLLVPGDPYRAYLLENIMPGEIGGRRKAPGRLRASEGAVAAFFARLATANPVRQRFENAAFYEAFGTTASDVAPIENAYLKIFTVLAEARPFNVVAFARSYSTRFPDEANVVRDMARDIGLDLDAGAPELWILNDAFTTGTTLFDQYRGIPRAHTFDLNAASLVDLLGVPGMTRAVANAILFGAPFEALDDLARVPGVTPALLGRFRQMGAAMTAMMADTVEEDAVLSLRAIFMPTIWRAVAWIAVGAAAGGVLYRSVRRVRVWRLVAIGTTAAFSGLAAAWILETTWWMPATIPLVVFACPAAAWQLAHKRPREAARVFVGWLLATLPTLAITRPMG